MPSQTVLITSITGFLGAQILHDAVEAGYKVVATVRDLGRGKAAVKQYASKTDIRLVECKDLVHGDLSDALKDVDAILHVASPYIVTGITKPEEQLLQPAIEGTLNVLRQAQKAGVTRIVITSSFAAIVNAAAGGAKRDYVYTEKDWNPTTYEQANDADKPGAFIYAASKKLAEKAAWEFAEQHKEMQITTCNPPMIYGPSLHSFESESSINTSSKAIWSIVSGKTESLPEDRLPLFCDVRDVSRAHILALTKHESIGQRVPLFGGSFVWADAVQYLQKERPELATRLPRMDPSAPAYGPMASIDTSVAREKLGMNSFIGWQKTLLDTVDDLLEQEKNGWKRH